MNLLFRNCSNACVASLTLWRAQEEFMNRWFKIVCESDDYCDWKPCEHVDKMWAHIANACTVSNQICLHTISIPWNFVILGPAKPWRAGVGVHNSEGVCNAWPFMEALILFCQSSSTGSFCSNLSQQLHVWCLAGCSLVLRCQTLDIEYAGSVQWDACTWCDASTLSVFPRNKCKLAIHL
jgi:hypothetical protein